MEIYRIEDVSFTFPEQQANALSNVKLNIHNGEFITICGKSGCGKSTLLRQLKTILTPHGKRSGNIYYRGQLIETIDQREQASTIGFVLQSPDNQIVTDKVWHELAFGLESLSYDNATIRLRVAEMASFFGIQNWFHKSVSELSGGQKQLLNLASIMVMHPSVLILDEPTSQLDPIASTDFLETISKINRELGTTILLTEHRLEEVLPLTDRLVVMDGGRIIADDAPRKVGQWLRDNEHPMFASMPSPMQIYAGVVQETEYPLTVKEGRQWLDSYTADKQIASTREQSHSDTNYLLLSEPAASVIEFKDVWFRYDRNGTDVIQDLSFKVRAGQMYCIVGGNGTGKTTTLSLISGIQQPYRGKVLIHGKDIAKQKAKQLLANGVGMLPQNPQTLFVKKTVEQDLYEMLSSKVIPQEQKSEKVAAVAAFCELESLLDKHPYDLSGGEQQRAALAKVLLLEPSILLLDEPTKGLDAAFKEKLAHYLQQLRASGVTIIIVSHDVEFCAKYGEVCAMFFDGTILTTNSAKRFFAGNSFYTTAANRMARHLWRECVTVEDVINECRRSQFLPDVIIGER